MTRDGLARVPVLLAALLALLLLGACQNKVEEADRYEALFDQLMTRNAHPAAAGAIGKAVVLDDNEPRRWLKLGFVSNIVNRPQAARNAYQRALDLAPDNVEALESLAVLSIRGRDFAGAKRFVQPLLLLSPGSAAGLYVSGAILIDARKYAEADAIAERLIREAQRPEGYMLRVLSLKAQGRLRAAAGALEQRLKLVPDDREFLLELLETYSALHDVAGVRRVSIALAPLFPKDPRYAMEAARALYAQGDTARARAEFDRLAGAYGGNPGLIGAIGRFWQEALPATAARDEIVRLAAGKSARVQARLGGILVDMGEAPAALALLASSAPAAVDAGNVDSQTSYARALLAAGRADPAEAKVAAILAFDTTNSAALLLRARIASSRGNLAAALADAQLAASGDLASEEGALLIARTYARMNNPSLAAKAFGDARQRFPNSFAVAESWADWLLSEGQAGQGSVIAADYARRHAGSDAAWALYGRLCRAAGGGACSDEVRRRGRPA